MKSIEARLTEHERLCEKRNDKADKLEQDFRSAVAASKPWIQIGQTILTGIAVALLVWLVLHK